MAGFQILGFLPFSFSQNSSEAISTLISTEMDKAWKDYGKDDPRYYSLLRGFSIDYRDTLERNCDLAAELYRNLGRYYKENGNLEAAIMVVRDTALQLALHCSDRNVVRITQIYQNIYTIHEQAQDATKATVAIDSLSAYLLREKISDEVHKGNMENFVGRFYLFQQQFEKAELWLQKSAATMAPYPENSKSARPQKNLFYLAYDKGNYEEAIAQSEKLFEIEEKYGHYIARSYIIQNLVKAYIEVGKLDKAESFFSELQADIDKYDDLNDRCEFLKIKSMIANRQGNYTESITLMEQAIELIREDNTPYYLATLPLFYERKYEAEDALGLTIEALSSAVEICKISSLTDSKYQEEMDFKNPKVFDYPYFNSGATMYLKQYIKLNAVEKSIELINDVDKLFFTYNRSLEGEREKQANFSNYHDFCDIVLGFLFEGEKYTIYPDLTAFYISSSKSLQLYENVVKRQDLPEPFKVRFSELQNEKSQFMSMYNQGKEIDSTEMVQAASIGLFETQRKVDQFLEESEYQKLIPDFSFFKNKIIEECRLNLEDENSAYLDFFVGKEAIYAFTCSQESLSFEGKEKWSGLKAERFLPYLTSSSNTEERAMFLDSLSAYFESYFPLEERIKQLAISSDADLLFLPFEFLDFEEDILLKRFAIHYNFSFLLDKVDRSSKSKSLENYVGFGMSYDDTLLSNISESVFISNIYDRKISLAHLSKATEEILVSQRIFGGKTFLESECTAEKFQEQASSARILHIANHSLLHERNSSLSSIVFAENHKPQLFNVIDVKALNINADLAILSSCNSGNGEYFTGNGIRSLGQSFAEAGCPSIVVNLWEANDKSSKIIIEEFNRRIQSGSTKSVALQQAKLAYLQTASPTLSQPVYWANLVVIGSNDPLNIGGAIPWKMMMIVGLGLLVLAFGLSQRKKRS